ncbi:MAG TPA: transcription-repair coupling factor [Vicinamibacterales bacterium]|nr:transcription-repair coupling factor [Vicinamibacterales bacterium]
MATAPSLALRSLLTGVLRETGLQSPLRKVSGATAPVRAMAVAAGAKRIADGIILYVVPTDAEIDTACADISFFLSAIEGSAATAVERQVLPFPSTQVDPYRGFQPHLKVASARARALHAIASVRSLGASSRSVGPRVIVASAAALLTKLPEPASLLLASCEIKPGVEIDPHELTNVLVMGGYEPADPVDAHGEFGRRGGILDIFPAGEELPIRIEFIGDTVESVRRFDPGTQRSIETLDRFGIVPVRESSELSYPSHLFQYLRTGNSQVWLSERTDVESHLKTAWQQIGASYADALERARGPEPPAPAALMLTEDEVLSELKNAVILEELSLDDGDGEAVATLGEHVALSVTPAAVFHGRIPDWINDIRAAQASGDHVVFVAGSHGRAERTVELLKDYDVRAVMATDAGDVVRGAVMVAEGWLSKGFRLRARATESQPLLIYAETDVFDEERRKTGAGRKRSASAAFLSDLRDLKVGDLIVHVDHGIGQFVGLKQISVAGGDVVQEFLELRYHADAKLFVPVERLDLIQKYTGGTKPPLDRLGGTTWEKAKSKVKKAMRDMAEELLKLYAARKAVPGHAFGADTHWQEEFEDAFEFDLTVDQATAIADIKRDMESPTPMDRLLCGDVGYGKTEVAMRAAFKAVMDGKQVAFLAPTTILAAQHLKTLRDRFAAFPAKIDMISRFRTRQEIKEALDNLAAGRLDIIVGTHRLLSKDVQFKDLGLLVVDEEQRFGVAHKERIKQMRKKVDVLTMTATPIPRTLNMSLVGIRDMSVIETPPKDRLAIQTNVVKFDSKVIVSAIRQEMERGGQVYFVHNRVESIYSMGNLLQRLLPDARVVIGHGQMAEDALERAMLDFMAHKYDILLATTIVENGLDIPNANTMIINRADRYGLSQLYQLRGRVGRSDRAAYAYLLIPPEEALSPVARKRLSAIKEFSDLGSGFRVAALDLEIRGAGNLLGGEQSGQIDAVGFEMYMKLLEETIRELKGEDLEDDVRATVNLKVDFRLDESYVPDMNQRLMIYRRMAGARSEDEIGRIVDEVRDRYGPPPTAVLNLADFARIRVMADALGVETIDRAESMIVIKFRQKTKVDLTNVIALVQDRSDLQLMPPNSIKLDLKYREPGTGSREPGVAIREPGLASREPGVASREPAAGNRQRKPVSAKIQRKPSWWVARATAGEVTPGFTKAEILKATPEDPRAPDGVLTKVTALLEDLST